MDIFFSWVPYLCCNLCCNIPVCKVFCAWSVIYEILLNLQTIILLLYTVRWIHRFSVFITILLLLILLKPYGINKSTIDQHMLNLIFCTFGMHKRYRVILKIILVNFGSDFVHYIFCINKLLIRHL